MIMKKRVIRLRDSFVEEKKNPIYKSPQIQALFDKEITRLNAKQFRRNPSTLHPTPVLFLQPDRKD